MKKKVYILLAVLVIFAFYAYKVLNDGNFSFFKYIRKELITTTNKYNDELNNKPFIVYDRKGDKIVEENLSNNRFSTASLAKLFTILYTVENVSMDMKVRVGDEIFLAGQNSSMAGLTVGIYTVKDLIKAAVIPSGNDAAYALAKVVLDEVENRDIPVDEINEEFNKHIIKFLEDEGFSDTSLVDPAGYGEANVSTATDLNSVIKKLYKYKEMEEIFNTYNTNIVSMSGENIYLVNTNKLMDPSSDVYDENVAGIKTGTLGNVSNIAVRYINGDKDLIFIINANDDEERYNLAKILIKEYS